MVKKLAVFVHREWGIVLVISLVLGAVIGGAVGYSLGDIRGWVVVGVIIFTMLVSLVGIATESRYNKEEEK